MSTSNFSIQDVYKENVPRKQVDLTLPVLWDDQGNPPLVKAASNGSPKYAVFVSELHIINNSIVFTNPSNANLFDIIFPNYLGDADITHVINKNNHIHLLADEIISINSVDKYIIKFKPIIMMQGSNDGYRTFTIQLNSDVSSINTGSIEFLIKGWTMKEADL